MTSSCASLGLVLRAYPPREKFCARAVSPTTNISRFLRVLNAELNDRPMRHLGQSRRQLFELLDRPALKPLPAQPYELATWKKARVHIDYHVEFEKHFYSVPYTLIHQEVDVRATERTIEIFYRQQRQAVHPRSTV